MTFAQCSVLFACCEQFNKCVCAKRGIPTFSEQLMHPKKKKKKLKVLLG